MRLATRLLIGTLAAAAAACGGSNSNPDGSTPGNDASTNDVTVNDGTSGHDGTGNGDGAVSTCTGTARTGTCAAAIDLSAMGTTSGMTTTITGNNCSAPMTPMSGLVGPSCATGTDGTVAAGYAVVFDYTMRTAGGLSAETDMGSAANFDSIVWIVDGCGGSAHELACNDDIDYPDNSQSLAITTHSVAAGTHVKIILAGFTPPASADHVSMSNFTLTVTEHALIAMGGTCDPAAAYCADGTSCAVTSAMATTGTCRMNGTEGANCNTTGTACSGTSAVGSLPLGCSNPTPTDADPGLCLGLNPNGSVCTSDDPLCNTNYTCVPDTVDGGFSMTMGHCMQDGAIGGVCTGDNMDHCDTGTCNDSGVCM